jgi:hypothetical protein
VDNATPLSAPSTALNKQCSVPIIFSRNGSWGKGWTMHPFGAPGTALNKQCSVPIVFSRNSSRGKGQTMRPDVPQHCTQ